MKTYTLTYYCCSLNRGEMIAHFETFDDAGAIATAEETLEASWAFDFHPENYYELQGIVRGWYLTLNGSNDGPVVTLV